MSADPSVRLAEALRLVAGEAAAARSALCSHELLAILENIERLCAEALSPNAAHPE